MTKDTILIIAGIVIIAASGYLARGHLWWYKHFFQSWGEVGSWFFRAGYITVGIIFLLIGIYGIWG